MIILPLRLMAKDLLRIGCWKYYLHYENALCKVERNILRIKYIESCKRASTRWKEEKERRHKLNHWFLTQKILLVTMIILPFRLMAKDLLRSGCWKYYLPEDSTDDDSSTSEGCCCVSKKLLKAIGKVICWTILGTTVASTVAATIWTLIPYLIGMVLAL